MDAQYPFASRDDIWRVFDELKELHLTQYEQGERLAQLERRRDEDARLRSPWAPVSSFPNSVGPIAPDPAFHTAPDAFKGFDQGHHSAMANSAVGFDSEEEPRRGASRANSVRFDESAIHGYGQASRSGDLPLRTGSGLSTHPLLERTFSHQSDGRLSSSGHSHHSARTNSLRLNTRLPGATPIESPLIPPPGLFLLGPVPSIIRCWLTDTFTNGSLLYAAVCSGSYVSTLGSSMIRNFGLEDMVMREDNVPYIKLPLYLPEALIHPSSSRPGTPTHRVPSVTIRFVVRETDIDNHSIQIIIGSDVMRAHNADILFSQDKLIMVDDEHNRVSVPLVRPEQDSVFKSLCTSPGTPNSGDSSLGHCSNGTSSVGIIGRPANPQQKPYSAPPSTRLSGSENGDPNTPNAQNHQAHAPVSTATRSATVNAPTPEPTKNDDMPPWGSWRRDAKKNASSSQKAEKREMKIFRTGRSTSHANSTTSASASSTGTTEQADKHGALNPVGGASAFGWLNSPHNAST